MDLIYGPFISHFLLLFIDMEKASYREKERERDREKEKKKRKREDTNVYPLASNKISKYGLSKIIHIR